MKREIVKPEYAENWLKHVGQYPNEYIYAVHGTANKQMKCDKSDEPIEIGDPCVAVSIYTPRTPYYEWEKYFIEPNGVVEGDNPKHE